MRHSFLISAIKLFFFCVASNLCFSIMSRLDETHIFPFPTCTESMECDGMTLTLKGCHERRTQKDELLFLRSDFLSLERMRRDAFAISTNCNWLFPFRRDGSSVRMALASTRRRGSRGDAQRVRAVLPYCTVATLPCCNVRLDRSAFGRTTAAPRWLMAANAIQRGGKRFID